MHNELATGASAPGAQTTAESIEPDLGALFPNDVFVLTDSPANAARDSFSPGPGLVQL